MTTPLDMNIQAEINALIVGTGYKAVVSVDTGAFKGNKTLSALLSSRVKRDEFAFQVDYFEPPFPGKVSVGSACVMMLGMIADWADERARLIVEAALKQSLEPFKGQPLTDELKPLVRAAMLKTLDNLNDGND